MKRRLEVCVAGGRAYLHSNDLDVERLTVRQAKAVRKMLKRWIKKRR